MTPRSDRTRPANKSDAALFFRKAEQFLEAMEQSIEAERWDAVGLSAIHSGISANDAVLAYHGGVRSASQDHRAAVELLKQTMKDHVATPSRHLARLIQKKNLVEYEQRGLTREEAEDLADHARRFTKWARTKLPARSS